jgi:hypothetical protein
MSIDIIFDTDPEDEERRKADDLLLHNRLGKVISPNVTDKWKELSDPSRTQQEMELDARSVFGIPENEDVCDYLFRSWESTLLGHHNNPEEVGSLVVSNEVLTCFGNPPYSEVILALQDSFREMNLFVGYTPRPAGDSIDFVFFLEELGKQHSTSTQYFGKSQEELRIENLKEDPTFDANSLCQQGLKALSEYAGDNAVNPRWGRYSSDTGFFFFPYSCRGRQAVFFINSQTGEFSLYKMGGLPKKNTPFSIAKALLTPEKIPFSKSQVHEVFAWLLRLSG